MSPKIHPSCNGIFSNIISFFCILSWPAAIKTIHLLKLYFRIKGFKADFFAKSPHQKWITVRKFNMFLLKLTGTHIMLPDWEKGIRLLIPAWLETNMFTLMLYTMFYYRNDPIKALDATTIISLMVPVSCC